MIWHLTGYFIELGRAKILRLMIQYEKIGQKIYHEDVIFITSILKQHLFLDQW